MVYNWDGKEAECYRLYVEEKKSLDEVVEYWEQRGFTPSKRAFQTQFRRWEFPSKQNPAYKNETLIARVKELWAANTTQKDMVEILRSEGMEVKDRELLRVRLRFNLHLREPRRKKESSNKVGSDKVTKKAVKKQPQKKKPKVFRGNGFLEQMGNAIMQEESSSEEDESEDDQEDQEGPEVQEEVPSEPPPPAGPDPEPLDPEEALRRQRRLQQLQIESAEKWRTRKRRRRTRGWAGLPADAPGEPPRFPSETTLDESKAYLSLDNTLYRQLRDQFSAMCEEEGVLKKTIAGPEKWSAIKHRLVRENAHLSNIFRQDPDAVREIGTMPTPSNSKALSLDVICTDVTKRLRTIGNRMGIPEAKNALGLNPEETRIVRSAFLAILKADRFTNKFESGDEHWNELKQTWIQGSELLTRVLAAGPADPKYREKTKAIEVIGRDVMKRLRAENLVKDPTRRLHPNPGPGPGPARPSLPAQASKPRPEDSQTTVTSAANNHTNMAQNALGFSSMSNASDFQIDPSLILAVSNPSILPNSAQHQLPPQDQSRNNHYALQHQFPVSLPLPIYFRLHPHSTTNMPNKTVWLGILQSGNVNEIRTMAMRDHPGTVVVKLEGLMVHKMPGHHDQEITVAIDCEDELAAYLQHVAGGKATFVVLLALAQGGGGYH